LARARRYTMPRQRLSMNRRTATQAARRAARASKPRPERPNSQVDPIVLFVVVTLVMVGLMVVYAVTFHRGISFLKWQVARAGVGLLALFVGTRLRHTLFAGPKLRLAMLLGTVGLLLATIVIGRSVGVATRWLGFIQPAELAKFVLPMWLAAYFADLKEKPARDWNFKKSVLVPGGVVVVFLVLTLVQPAISTTVIVAVAAFLMFLVAGVKLRFLVPIGLVAVALVFFAIRYTPYAQQRIREWREGDRYQQKQSLIAFGSGGLVGKGLGEGKQKFYFLPKLHTDFIVAAVGEEFGFLGSLALFALYGTFLVAGMLIGLRANSHFGQYLSTGIVMTIFMYAMVHMGVALGILPPTGQPLPFVSFGGSALVTNLFAAGVLLNVSRFQRRPDEGPAGRGWNRRPRLSRAGTR
jgi:cell division protein FtsW